MNRLEELQELLDELDKEQARNREQLRAVELELALRELRRTYDAEEAP